MSAIPVERTVERPIPDELRVVGLPSRGVLIHILYRASEERTDAARAYALAQGWRWYEGDISPEDENEAFSVADGAAHPSDGPSNGSAATRTPQ
jgi:hypothetical protein